MVVDRRSWFPEMGVTDVRLGVQRRHRCWYLFSRHSEHAIGVRTSACEFLPWRIFFLSPLVFESCGQVSVVQTGNDKLISHFAYQPDMTALICLSSPPPADPYLGFPNSPLVPVFFLSTITCQPHVVCEMEALGELGPGAGPGMLN